MSLPDEIASKMRGAGLSEAAVASFTYSYGLLKAGGDGTIAEDSIEPASGLPTFVDVKAKGAASVTDAEARRKVLLDQTVVLKLNGGLGTGMGLDKAKSLLTLRGEDTFLDFIAQQVAHARQRTGGDLRFVLMNSFSTSDDTRAFLEAKYPEVSKGDWELYQNKVPKIDAATLLPASYSPDPECEWCPPGHGDVYPSLLGTGMLDRLLAGGFKYMFVSNSDNLGATLDEDILGFFSSSESPFMMEVCERTPADKKGGHLARRKADGKLILRESAQCAKVDEDKFQDVSVHRYFNTNNLWVRLDALKAAMDANGGALHLPVIKNSKTVNPRDANSTKVFQLETAMGAAIEVFEGAGALVVPRTRFAPVKTCNDLMLLRSDAYEVTSDRRMVLSGGKTSGANVDLDSKHYKMVDGLEAHFGTSAPSMKDCTALTVKGSVKIGPGCTFKGNVTVVNDSGDTKTLKDGVYDNVTTGSSDLF